MRTLTRNAPAGRHHQPGHPPGHHGTRAAALNPATYNASARTVEAVLSAGTRVRRYFGFEELEVSATAIDLSRAQAGLCPLLNAHNQGNALGVLGTLIAVAIRGTELIGTIRFADSAAGREAEAMVTRGELAGVSIGYNVRTWQMVEQTDDEREVWRATSWELMEVSIVPVPADPAAGFRAAQSPDEENDMLIRSNPDDAPPPRNAPRDTITARSIMTAARNAGLDIDAADELLEQHERTPFNRSTMMAAIGQRFAERDSQAVTINRNSPLPNGGRGGPGELTARMTDALFARMSGAAPAESAREFMGVSLTGMARALLEERGESVRFMSDASVLERALHTTSDFPGLLQNGGNRYLTQTYEAAASPLKALARQRTSPDFREITNLQLSNAPRLDKVGEGGEIQRGTFTESSERYAIATFAKIFALSRQAIINDDLQAFANALGLMARAAAEQEAQSLADLLNANGGLGPKMANGKMLFHADHKNLAPAGAILSLATLSEGRQAMRNQKDLNGTTYINAVPKTLLVGPAQETLAEQVLTAIEASKTADVNPFPGKLTPAVDPRLTGNGWRLFADPAQAAVLEYAYLNGSKGPQLEQRQGWDVLGTEFRVVNDFGCAAVDTRGGWHNPGSN